MNSTGETLDRLSELPDSLILEILSSLETRDVVRTTLLSKRWKDFWVTIPCLKFIYHRGDIVKIRNFVYRTLTLWRGKQLREFTICFSDDFIELCIMDMALWVHFATDRKVEELCIEQYHSSVVLWLPQCLYKCSSIRKLSLYGCDIQIHGDVKWDCLNTLKLLECRVSEDAMNQVFSSSPKLETLMIRWLHRLPKWSIRSSSLKKLWIISPSYYPIFMPICVPNPFLLSYLGTPFIKCLLTGTSSLTEVHLDYVSACWHEIHHIEEALYQILPAIQHLVTVKLSASCFKILRGGKGKKYSFSPYLNVKILRIESGLFELSKLGGVLEFFPKLIMLVIDCKLDATSSDIGEPSEFKAGNYKESEVNILNSNLLQLRTVEITWYVFKVSFVKFIGFLLKHATMIEKIVIRNNGKGVDNSEEMFQAAQSLQRSFPNVQLILS